MDRKVKSQLIIGTHGVQYFTPPKVCLKVCFGTLFNHNLGTGDGTKKMNVRKSSKEGRVVVIFNHKNYIAYIDNISNLGIFFL